MTYKHINVRPETADRLDKLADAKGMKKLDLIEAMVAAMENDGGEEVDVPDVPDNEALIDEVLQVRDSSWRTAINIDAKTEAVLNWLYALRGTKKVTTIWDCVVAAYALQQRERLQAGVETGEILLKLRPPRKPR